MMLKEEIKEAIATGHKASSILSDVLEGIVSRYHCPAAFGFEGPDTFSDCEEDDCIYCIAKAIHKGET